jgi:kynurenine formamidase
MCDQTHFKGTKWQGWIDIPEPVMAASGGAWVDLSHVLTEDLYAIPDFPPPTLGRWKSMPEFHANVTMIQMVAHHGTHLDAPNHFIEDAPSFDHVPLARLWGPGVVWSFNVGDYGVIDVADLEAKTPECRPGDIVLIDTSRAALVHTPAYSRHASLSQAAAEWLLQRRVKIVGVDFATPDLAPSLRKEGFYWPVHHTLLPHGVLIAEHVANLSALSDRRIEAFFTGLRIAGSDGAPARPIARAVD